ncbi:MAG TPA: FmdE family protein [Candidatus Bathyarchaeia archaeon]|nr:FmdE family protein [Candidatus Bathyarchaeia archaeon]
MSITVDKLERLMDNYGIEERIREYIRQCVSFHGFVPPGLLIGVFMVDLALEKLGANTDAKLYAVAETPKCAPDAVQVITSATIGNKQLRIIDTGKFSITLNRGSTEERADGIRVYVDATKIRRYPTLDLWYTNDPRYKRVEEKDRVYDEILQAGRSILSWERVRVLVPQKAVWRAVQCPVCKEMVPDYLVEDGVCASCAGVSYFERSP